MMMFTRVEFGQGSVTTVVCRRHRAFEDRAEDGDDEGDDDDDDDDDGDYGDVGGVHGDDDYIDVDYDGEVDDNDDGDQNGTSKITRELKEKNITIYMRRFSNTGGRLGNIMRSKRQGRYGN